MEAKAWPIGTARQSFYHPNTLGDIAWPYNHHGAGLIVLTVGLLVVLARSGVASWARNWLLAFLGLAVFLFQWAGPENRPIGPRRFWTSFAVAAYRSTDCSCCSLWPRGF
jgi:hypothetical protein